MEAGFPVRIQDVEEKLKTSLEEIYGHNTWSTIKRRGDVDTVLTAFEQGDALNYMLSWYLEDQYSRYSCQPETGGSDSEFDVTLLDQDIPLCGIELKRAGSSNRISNYLEEHRTKCEGPREARKYLLVNLFPISKKMDSVRTTDLVFGYGLLSPETHKFYEQECSHVANIAAPLFREEDSVTPLQEIYRVMNTKLSISP
ncbi:hypothetical protein [Natronococcus jeotgali]|uniref:hypothetical protein n=1 Tax=Natronococcus jeotgali TaxID=413812 RepID=UPI001268ACBF|nr:hypothetical protein [Natronococcus jeotgali]